MATKPKKLKFEKYSFEGQVLHDLNKITAELKSLRRKEEKLMADLTALQAFVVEFSYSSYFGLPIGHVFNRYRGVGGNSDSGT